MEEEYFILALSEGKGPRVYEFQRASDGKYVFSSEEASKRMTFLGSCFRFPVKVPKCALEEVARTLNTK